MAMGNTFNMPSIYPIWYPSSEHAYFNSFNGNTPAQRACMVKFLLSFAQINVLFALLAKLDVGCNLSF